MPKTAPENEEDDKPAHPERPPLDIPILPNTEQDPLPPEPIEAPPDPDGQQPIDENPKSPKTYV